MAQAASSAPSTAGEQFRERLFGAGLLLPTGIDGLMGRSAVYESVVGALSNMAHSLGVGHSATLVSFPPVVSKQVFERTGFPESFPNLVGAVRGFSGSSGDHAHLRKALDGGEDWSERFVPTDLFLASAACHPIYPMCAGKLPAGGRRFEVSAYCFRHEPSSDPARMQTFRMYEHVYVGEPATARTYRDEWLAVGCAALASLGLEATTVPANDPFFGRGARLLADLQREEERKVEIVVLLPGYAAPTAVASGNAHQDHFGSQFGIKSADGEVAHSSCMAFGLDRLTLALLATHGLAPADWPQSVRAKLWPEA